MNMTVASDGSDKRMQKRQRPGLLIWLPSLVVIALIGVGASLIRDTPVKSTPARGTVDSPSVTADTTNLPHRVVAYYFHTTYRCPSCRKIEAYSQLAIETGFASELADGRLEWRIINVEDNGNEHFVPDYKLYTKSLILSDERSGREVRWKNLAKVWELLGNEAAFVDYVQTETRAYLAEAP